jgi:hypothetical protein
VIFEPHTFTAGPLRLDQRPGHMISRRRSIGPGESASGDNRFEWRQGAAKEGVLFRLTAGKKFSFPVTVSLQGG